MDGVVRIKAELDTKSFEKQIAEVEYELEQIDYELSHAKELKLDTTAIREYELRAEKLTNHLVRLREQQQKLNENGFKEFGKSMNAIIKKVGKWALAVFGIRSAYLAIRQAMSTLTEYDETLKADLQYIRFAIATALEPIIRVIVDLAYKLLGIINLISIKLFNYDLFSKATVNNFKKMNGEANKLKKTLAGFDEMNIIGDNSGASNLTPSMDMSKATKDVDNWLKKLKRNFQKNSVKIFGALFDKNVMNGILGEWDLFGQGIGETIIGIGKSFDGLFKQVKGIFRTLKGIFTGDINEISSGITEFLQGLSKTIFEGIPTMFRGLGDTLLGIIKGTLTGMYNLINTIFINPAKELLKPFVDWIDKNFVQKIKDRFNKLPDWAKTLIRGIVNQAIATINFLIDQINNILLPFRLVITAFGKIMGKDWNLQTISIPKVPYLAKGAIANQPGRGIPTFDGGARWAENGAEAYLPLTDEQIMSTLGQSIGKHVTINATIPVYAYNRQVDRQMRRIQAEDTFASNE